MGTRLEIWSRCFEHSNRTWRRRRLLLPPWQCPPLLWPTTLNPSPSPEPSPCPLNLPKWTRSMTLWWRTTRETTTRWHSTKERCCWLSTWRPNEVSPLRTTGNLQSFMKGSQTGSLKSSPSLATNLEGRSQDPTPRSRPLPRSGVHVSLSWQSSTSTETMLPPSSAPQANLLPHDVPRQVEL